MKPARQTRGLTPSPRKRPKWRAMRGLTPRATMQRPRPRPRPRRPSRRLPRSRRTPAGEHEAPADGRADDETDEPTADEPEADEPETRRPPRRPRRRSGDRVGKEARSRDRQGPGGHLQGAPGSPQRRRRGGEGRCLERRGAGRPRRPEGRRQAEGRGEEGRAQGQGRGQEGPEAKRRRPKALRRPSHVRQRPRKPEAPASRRRRQAHASRRDRLAGLSARADVRSAAPAPTAPPWRPPPPAAAGGAPEGDRGSRRARCDQGPLWGHGPRGRRDARASTAPT